MKRILSFVLALMMVLNMGITAFADVTFETTATQILKGETVTVTIKNGEKMTGVTTFGYNLYFDPTLFELQSSTVGDAQSATQMSNVKTNTKGSYYSITYVDNTSEGQDIPVGTIYTLVFKAKSDITSAKDGRFMLERDAVWNSDFEDYTGVGNVGGDDTFYIEVIPEKVPATSITLNSTEVSIEEGKSFLLDATIEPNNTTDKITFESSDSAVATVDKTGKIVAVKEGTTTITAKVGDKTATCAVTVTKEKSAVNKHDKTYGDGTDAELTGVKSIKFGGETVDIKNIYKFVLSGNEEFYLRNSAYEMSDYYKMYKLDGTLVWGDATWGTQFERVSINYSWGDLKTSDIKVTYDALKEAVGDDNISKLGVDSDDNLALLYVTGGSNKYAVLFVTETIAATEISIPETKDLEVGKSTTLTVTYTPTGAEADITWTSSDNSVATVDENGKVTAVKCGTATITAKAGSLSDTCTVTVYDKVEDIPGNGGGWTGSVKEILVSVPIDVCKWDGKTVTVYIDGSTNGTVKVRYNLEKRGTSSSETKEVAVTNGTGTCEDFVYEGNTWVVKFAPTVPATAISLNKTTTDIILGEEETLVATITPENSTENVKWESSDNNIATVDKNGKVKAITEGKATITAKVGELSTTCEVNCKAVHATAVAISGEGIADGKLRIKLNDSLALTVTTTPEKVTDKAVWTSTDSDVAEVVSGKLNAKKEGKATVTVTVGSVSASLEVEVYAVHAESITLDKTEITVAYGDSETIKATVAPEGHTDGKVQWTSTETSVATVDSNGKVKAVGVGTTTITAKIGEKTATCTVTVPEFYSTKENIPQVLTSDWGEVEITEIIITGAKVEETTWAEDDNNEKTICNVKLEKGVADGTKVKVILKVEAPFGSDYDFSGEATVTNGKATVTVTCSGWNVSSKTLTFNMESESVEVTEVTLNKNTLKLDIGKDETLTATVAPENATNKTVTWESADASIATVDENGKVTAVAAGTTNITATASGKTATCAVTVVDPTVPRTITVKVSTKTTNVTFYTDKEATNEFDASLVKDNGVVSNYHMYEITVANGTYYFRGNDGGTNIGGMSFTVDSDTTQINLRRVNFCGQKKDIATKVGDFSVKATSSWNEEIVMGTQYVDSSKGAVTPAFVLVKGNSGTDKTEYTPVYELFGDAKESYILLAKSSNATKINMNTIAQTVYFYVDAAPSKITAPKGATVEVFNQVKNFNVEKVEATAMIENDDGTVTYSYTIPANKGSYTYRVSMEGKLTHAGYFKSSTYEHVVVTFEGDPAPTTTTSTVTGSNAEASTMLNVNGQNNLQLAVGDTFRLRAYRGAWQIINTTTANIMIEPDFNYNVISGGEHITLTPASNRCSGNAGSGDFSNWMDIEGVSEGVAIIEVSYNAIKIGGQGTTMTGIYGATDPNRTSLVVIEVGAAGSSASVTADGSTNVWDTEYDTVYFTENSGSFTFTAKVGENNAEKAELSTDNGKTWTTISSADGKFTATGISSGNNIIRLTANGETAYQVVRGAKVTYTVKNTSRDSDKIYVGDTIEIHFNGLYMPIPKFSGIYNPGYGSFNPGSWVPIAGSTGHRIKYSTMPDGTTYTSTSGQYSFVNDNKITITVANEGANVFEGGYIDFSVMGVDNPLGGHRLLTDDGVGANMNAVSTSHTRAVIPNITINVETTGISLDKTTLDLKCNNEPVNLTATLSDDIKEKQLEWESSDNKVVTVDQNGKVTVVGEGEATITVKTKAELDGTGASESYAKGYSKTCAVKVSHNWDEGTVTTPATCNKVGEKTFVCKNDSSHKRYEEVAIDENAHDWSVSYEWSTDGKTCTATHVCGNNSAHNETANATVTSTVAVPATCKTMGDTQYKATFSVSWATTQYTSRTDIAIDEDAHQFGAWSIVKEPTYTKEGLMQRECGLCGHIETKSIPKKVETESKPNPGVSDIIPEIEEKNPNTGAPVFDLTTAGIIVLAVTTVVIGKKRRK